MTDQQKKRGILRENAVYIFLLFVVFLFGLSITGWQWWDTARNYAEAQAELDKTKIRLTREKIEGLLKSAIIEAQRADYSLALRDSSQFFTELKEDIDQNDKSAYSAGEREQLKSVFAVRDEINANLAKRESASITQLNDVYVIYQKATQQYRESSGSSGVDSPVPGGSDTGNQNAANSNSSDQNSANANSENRDSESSDNPKNANADNSNTLDKSNSNNQNNEMKKSKNENANTGKIL